MTKVLGASRSDTDCVPFLIVWCAPSVPPLPFLIVWCAPSVPPRYKPSLCLCGWLVPPRSKYFCHLFGRSQSLHFPLNSASIRLALSLYLSGVADVVSVGAAAGARTGNANAIAASNAAAHATSPVSTASAGVPGVKPSDVSIPASGTTTLAASSVGCNGSASGSSRTGFSLSGCHGAAAGFGTE